MINIQNVQKSFGKQVVIENFSLSIQTGEIHVLLGASGSGKTTLLRMIGGLEPTDKGVIDVNGKRIFGLDKRERTSRLAYCTQEGGLFPHLTNRENILLPARVRKLEQKVIVKRMESLLHMVDLDIASLDKFPHELSGGQRQRVSLMRGLILDPEVVLLDEPLSALDPIVRSSLQRQLKSIFKELRKTVVVVTHDLQEASFLGDRITLLNGGRVVQTGSFSDLFHNAADPFVHEFVRAQIPMEINL
jgi:osmoprotectant transport system ATP-binding protein